LAKLTVPGPLSRVQVIESELAAGKASSVTVPLSEALVVSAMVWSGPALTAAAD
jgi:hypothetical protein